MAYVHSSFATGSNNSKVSEITVPLSANDSGDLAVVVVGSHHNSATWQQKSGTTGWTLHNNTNTGTYTFAIFYKFVGASEADPTFEEASAATDYTNAVVTVIKGAHATPFITYSSTQASEAMQFTLPTVDTTGYDDALILHHGVSVYSRSVIYTPLINSYASYVVSSNSIQAGWFQQQAGGTTPAIDMLHDYSGSYTIGHNLIAIRDDGTGAIRGHVKPTVQPAELLQGLHWNHYTQSNEFSTGSNLIPTLDGNTTNYKATSNNSANLFNELSDYPYVAIQTSNASTPDATTVTLYDSTKDLSNSLIQITLGLSTYDSSLPWASGGRYLGVVTGADVGASIWKVEAADTALRVKSGVFPYIIDTSVSSYETHGTVDLTDVQRLVLGIHRNSTTATVLTGIYKLDTMILVYGNSSNPCSFKDGARHAKTASLRTVQAQGGQADSQFYISQSIDIGDYGTSATYWKSSNQSMEMPAAYDVASRFVHHQIDTSRLFFTVKAGAGDTINLSSCTLNFGDFHNFVIGASCSASATYNFNGLVVLNSLVELNPISGYDYEGVTFSGCKELTTNGADLSGGCTISNCVDAQAITISGATEAALQAELDKLANCAFKNNDDAIRVEFTGTGDIELDFTSITWTGNTTDIHYNSTNASALTAVMESGSNATTSDYDGSATGVTISAPVAALTVTSNIAASDIKIFDTGTQTVEASTTGTSTSTTAAGTYDITVMKAGYLPQRQTGVTLGSSDVDVNITLVEDPVYTASHGLTWAATTSPSAGEVHWARATRRGYLADNQQGVDVYSALIDFWIAQSALDNTEFPIVAVGPDRFEFTSDGTTAAQLDSGSVTYWKGAGMTWEHATTGNDTHRYCSVKSVGTIGGTTKVRYVQEEGGTVNSVTLVGGVVDQVIQYYSDTNGDGTPDYNYDSHLVFKTFSTDYYQARNNVLASFGISALEPYDYIFVLSNSATGTASGDQSFTPVVTNQQGSPVEEQAGYTFSFKVTEASNSKSPEEYLAQWLYDTYTDPTAANLYGSSLRAFDLPCPVVESGGTYSSVYQYVEDTEDSTEKHGFYFEESSSYHPDFLQQQEDEDSGSGFYVTPIVAQISITNLPDDVGGDTRLQIYNTTTATLIYSGDPAGTGYTDTYTDGDAAYASSGDSIRIRFSHANAGTSFELGQTTVLATSSGIVADGDNFISADSVYATNGIDGSTITKFTYTPVNDQFNLVVNSNFTAADLYAFYCYTLTTADGIEGAYGALIASDAGNYKNITAVASIYLDNETTASKRQTDTARIYRDDGAYPVLDPTTSGFGIDINWQNVVYVVTAGSGLTAGQASELTTAASIKTTTDQLTFTKANELDINVKSVNGTSISGSGTEVDPWGP